MSNSCVKIEKKKKRPSVSHPNGIIGEYATVEDAIEAKKAKLLEAVPQLNLSVLLQQLGK
ncbi:hypothetical protein SAMN04487996_115122 [Dyadobacter soli]|uniref:Uncharacterized protein n=1 Tax=Dyadobacter soli TaxID=659014 RepID=A0A1G7RPM3_9BACT|nr:hypothetical protein [Dyadobacter soli]SDG12778.1 hypothetical protein SAMN04487996_115122 [Dyadobacter soli]